MKKHFLFSVAFMLISLTYAQQFGLKAGYNSTSVVVTFDGTSDSESIGGFYIGGFTEFALSDKFNLQPEVQFVSVSENGEKSNFLNIPFVFKYLVSDDFSLQVGPQLSFLLDEKVDDFTNLGIDAVLGLGYDLSENFFIDARYSLNLNNRYTGQYSNEIKAKYNAFQFGVGYRF